MILNGSQNVHNEILMLASNELKNQQCDYKNASNAPPLLRSRHRVEWA